MLFQVPIQIDRPGRQINYADKILLIGSCFTEHIGNSLEELKFSVLQNPNGILFDPKSVSRCLLSYIENRQYREQDFFQLNEVWYTWDHHSRFARTNLDDAIDEANQSQQKAHNFLKVADWIIITLGSSFSYRLTDYATKTERFLKRSGEDTGVANCHRAPAQWFDKQMMTVGQIISALDNCIEQLFQFNSKLNIIFTVSPVRHIRDGVVDNNRSKARLIEAVHDLVNKRDRLYYFPAYELVIDVLRDYRFYDIDLVHPNYMATAFVLEKFAGTCIDELSQKLMEEIKTVVTARKHRAFQPETAAHKQFLKTYFEKAKALKAKYSFLDFDEEISYFNS